MIRMLIVGYVFVIRSERALCREVQAGLAYRCFVGLSIEDKIPDHSAFSRARNERFGDSAIFRSVFEHVVGACIGAGLVGGEGFAVDANRLLPTPTNRDQSLDRSGTKNLCARGEPDHEGSISPPLMTRHSVRPARSLRSSFRHPIQRRNGQARCEERRSSPTLTTI